LAGVELASNFKDLMIGILVILSLALFVIGMISYRRTGNPRIRMVTAAFAVFLIKGLFLVVGLYLTDWFRVPSDFGLAFGAILAADVVVLTLLYLALFRRPGGH